MTFRRASDPPHAGSLSDQLLADLAELDAELFEAGPAAPGSRRPGAQPSNPQPSNPQPSNPQPLGRDMPGGSHAQRDYTAQYGGAAPAHDDDAELPLGVEPWSGDEMPAGRASSHGLLAASPDPLAPGEAALDAEPALDSPAPSSAPAAPTHPPDEAPLLTSAADELNYRHLYETRYRDLEAGARENAARHASGSDLFALCLDPSPRVVAALLENSEFGLGHARALAQHHQTDRGLEILARRAQLLRDSHVQRRLLQNAQTPDVVLERVLRFKRMLDIYRMSVDRDLPERNRVRVRSRLRPYFTRAEPEDRAALVIKTEGRCLNSLAGCTFDSRTTQILCNLSTYSTLFIQNLARFSATPPMLIAKLLKSPSVQRQPQLRAMLVRHPNAGGEAKRKG
jgi:hypothetical protein